MLTQRLRRNRKSKAIRALTQETHIHPTDLVLPLFIKEGSIEPIASMPNVVRHNLDSALREIERVAEAQIPAVALFPVIDPALKDATGSESLNPESLLFRAIREIKARFPEVCIISDVALDPYTTHGHDGVVNAEGEVLNDPTVRELVSMAIAQAEAGADIVAPSDMMDGRVGAIRQGLDAHGFEQTSILSYTVKYASSLYAPFREAVASPLRFADKLTYQLNPANQREALLEAATDEREGADMLMVKPAGLYLDIIAKFKESTHLPVAAYQVSGEYALIKAAAEKGWIDAEKALLESLLSIKRAGADLIFTYAALSTCECALIT